VWSQEEGFGARRMIQSQEEGCELGGGVWNQEEGFGARRRGVS
jgi:hypothetical protein